MILNLSLSTRLALEIVAHVVLYYWTRYVVAPAPIGKARVQRAIPLIPVIWFLTALFDCSRPDEFFLAVHNVVNFLWLTSSKLWSFCMNRGQVAKSYDSGNNTAFALSLLFGIVVDFKEIPRKEDKDHPLKKNAAYTDVRFEIIRFSRRDMIIETGKIVLRVIAKLAMMLAMKRGYYFFDALGYFFWRDACIGWFLYGNTSTIQDLIFLGCLWTLNLKLAANFDKPWLSTSMQEMWSRRYNITFGETLRDLVYNPIADRSWVHRPTYCRKGERVHPLRKAVATLATFIASGVIHSLLLTYAIGIPFPVMYCLYFVMSGFVVILEGFLKSLIKQYGLESMVREYVPTWVYRIYFLGILFTLLHKFFLVEMTATGFANDFLQGMSKAFEIS